VFSTAVYLPLQCSLLLYIFYCCVQYCRKSSTAASTIAAYLLLQYSVLLYIGVQYRCISSTAVFSTAVYLPLQCYILSHATNLPALVPTPQNTGVYSIHVNPPLNASTQSTATSSPPGMTVVLLVCTIRPDATTLFVNPTKYCQRSPSTLILNLCYKNHLKTSRIHFSLLRQPITARWNADHSNKVAVFTGRWPLGSMKLQWKRSVL
jgi:hypothetical protein